MEGNEDYSFRVISNQVRFGCGYRTVNGKRQYFAWHGHPDRNSDFFTTAEVLCHFCGRRHYLPPETLQVMLDIDA